MKRKIVPLLLLISVLCSGCGKTRQYKHPNIVTSIFVTQSGSLGHQQHLFYRSDEMHLILNGLRSLGQPYRTDLDPETMATDHYCITLLYADGSQRTHQIRGDRYMRTENDPWQQTEPRKVTQLISLLSALLDNVPLENSCTGMV